jgi:nucleoid-associated protein YgaU
MGLFDFVSDMGNKMFGKDEDADENIKAHIEENNPGIEDMQVSYNNGTVNLSGTAESPEAMEKAVLMAGNIQGVEAVNIDGMNVPEATEKVEYYVIQSGDTLSALAKKYYGKAADYPRIFEANREVIIDPDKIYVGQKIRIPLD